MKTIILLEPWLCNICNNSNRMKCSLCLVIFVAISFASATELSKDLERIAGTIGGRVGVSAVLTETGEHVALHGDQRFFMASVVKFPVALRVLQLVDDGKLRLDQKVPVSPSDLAPGVSQLGGNYK